MQGSARSRRVIEQALAKLPPLAGNRIHVSFQSALTAYRGKLLSGNPERGIAVYAGSFIRGRTIVLESELLSKRSECERILIHELFHFAWVRCNNHKRLSFEDLLQEEMAGRARGELGESAERCKGLLTETDLRDRTRRWREYACESFCDTAAWFFQKKLFQKTPAPDCNLAKKWQGKRARWFHIYIAAPIQL